MWMRSDRLVRERLTANAKVAAVLGSTPASSDTIESEGRHAKQCWKKVFLKHHIQSEYKISEITILSPVLSIGDFDVSYHEWKRELLSSTPCRASL
jgi:hypothetical protein